MTNAAQKSQHNPQRSKCSGSLMSASLKASSRGLYASKAEEQSQITSLLLKMRPMLASEPSIIDAVCIWIWQKQQVCRVLKILFGHDVEGRGDVRFGRRGPQIHETAREELAGLVIFCLQCQRIKHRKVRQAADSVDWSLVVSFATMLLDSYRNLTCTARNPPQPVSERMQ